MCVMKYFDTLSRDNQRRIAWIALFAITAGFVLAMDFALWLINAALQCLGLCSFMSILPSPSGRVLLWMRAERHFDRVASRIGILGGSICAQTLKR